MGELMTYYNLSRNLLSLIGLWPYDGDRFRTLKNSLYSLTCFSLVFVQFMAFKTNGFATKDFLNKIPFTIIYTNSFVTYNVHWFHLPVMKDFMNRIACDWNTKHRQVLQIIEKHASIGRHYGLLFILLLYPTGICVILCHMTMSILDNVVPRNESRLDKFPITVEYFAIQEKFYVLTLLHMYTVVMMHITVFVASGSFVIMCLQHADGLYEVASYYIREAIVNASKEFSGVTSKRDMANAVEAHKNAMKFYHDLVDTNEAVYSILILLVAFSLSCNLFHLSQSILALDEIVETVICVVIISCELLYMFLMHFLIQCVSDTSNKLVPIIFQSTWYDISVSSQKMLINIMIMCSKPLAFTPFGFYSVSMEGFSSLLRLSFSYFMVLSSVTLN